MRSTFFGLSSAFTGIAAHQRALDTVNHNVGNTDTAGYSRQRVELSANVPYTNPAWNTPTTPGQLGTGVKIQEMVRVRDQFIDVQYRDQNAKLGTFDARAEALERLNQIVDEPGDNGLTAQLGTFWASWQSLSTRPEGAAPREAVRAAADALALGFNDTRTRLVESQDEANARIDAAVADVNRWVGQINTLNKEIFKVQALGHEPNDLKDQRDVLIDSISKAGNLTVTTAANGKVSLNLGGQVLLDGTADTGYPVSVTAGGAINVGANAATVTEGTLRGLVDIRDTVIGGPTGYIAKLDALAKSIIDETNAIHSAGVGLDGSTSTAFFAGTDAAGMAVSTAVKGSTDAIAASSTAAGLPGDSGNAVKLAQLRFSVLTIDGATTTIDGAWGAWVSKLGSDTDQATRLREVQQNVLHVAQGRRDSVSGVNLDEEMADMVRFQKSYNAAARMVTTMDSMLETIVDRMGLVGR
ncbi:MAG: flagellar hook-associated protein FlgK [Thermoleophilia bacterium]|nr:flagellar hook-associated protein FlgK [Thermoleophilia bacterium]